MSVSDVPNFAMLKTKRPLGVEEARASLTESASLNAANHAVIAETADAVVQPRGAPVVLPRIFKGVDCCPKAVPMTKSCRPIATQATRTIVHSQVRLSQTLPQVTEVVTHGQDNDLALRSHM